MKKLTLILAAMVLTASQAFGQCGKCGYEVKAENSYTNYNVRYASNPMDAKHYTTDRLRGEFAIEKTVCCIVLCIHRIACITNVVVGVGILSLHLVSTLTTLAKSLTCC